MSKELEALEELKHWKETNNENGVVWLPLFAVEDIEQALIKAEQNKKIINELKTLIKYADLNKQRIISLAVLKNALEEVL